MVRGPKGGERELFHIVKSVRDCRGGRERGQQAEEEEGTYNGVMRVGLSDDTAGVLQIETAAEPRTDQLNPGCLSANTDRPSDRGRGKPTRRLRNHPRGRYITFARPSRPGPS